MKRSSYYLVFGEGDTRWAAPDPTLSPGEPMANAYHYLTHGCPDTKTAVAKLREIRRALRERPGKEPTR